MTITILKGLLIMLAPQISGINLDTIQNTIGNAAETLESQLQESMNQISSNPSPSPGQLAEFQATLQLYSNIQQLQSSCYKVFNDLGKQIVTNAAS